MGKRKKSINYKNNFPFNTVEKNNKPEMEEIKELTVPKPYTEVKEKTIRFFAEHMITAVKLSETSKRSRELCANDYRKPFFQYVRWHNTIRTHQDFSKYVFDNTALLERYLDCAIGIPAYLIPVEKHILRIIYYIYKKEVGFKEGQAFQKVMNQMQPLFYYDSSFLKYLENQRLTFDTQAILWYVELDDKELEEYGLPDFKKLVQDAVSEACVHFAINKYMLSVEKEDDKPIEYKDEIPLLLPEHPIETIEILCRILEHVFNDLKNLFYGMKAIHYLDIEKDNQIRTLTREKNELEKKNKKTEETNKNLQLRLETILEQKRSKKENEQTKEANQKIKELEFQLRQENKKIEALEEQIKLLEQQLKKKEETNEPKNNNEEKQPIIAKYELKEEDYQRKFLFLCSEEVAIGKRLKNTFPNSVVTEKSYPLNNTFEMVICLTNNIGHPAFYRMKNMCDVKGIKFLSCEKTNIEYVKQYIAEELQNRISDE